MSIEKFEERFCIVDGMREPVAIRVITYKDLIQLMPLMPFIKLEPEEFRLLKEIVTQDSDIGITD